MKELVGRIVGALVDFPEEVEIQENEGTTMTLLQIRVSKEDVGKLIGKKGKNISALRIIVAGAGKGRRYMVEVLEENRPPPRNEHLQHDRDPGIDRASDGEGVRHQGWPERQDGEDE